MLRRGRSFDRRELQFLSNRFAASGEKLFPGLYLVVGERHQQDGKRYDFSPFLISLPEKDPEEGSGISDDYYVIIEQDGTTFVVTNIYLVDIPPEDPPTTFTGNLTNKHNHPARNNLRTGFLQ